jgi:hypothetical protein
MSRFANSFVSLLLRHFYWSCDSNFPLSRKRGEKTNQLASVHRFAQKHRMQPAPFAADYTLRKYYWYIVASCIYILVKQGGLAAPKRKKLHRIHLLNSLKIRNVLVRVHVLSRYRYFSCHLLALRTKINR